MVWGNRKEDRFASPQFALFIQYISGVPVSKVHQLVLFYPKRRQQPREKQYNTTQSHWF